MTRVRPAESALPGKPRSSILWTTANASRRSSPRSGVRRHRFWHAADLAWALVETVLAARSLSNLIVVAVTLGVAALYARDAGLDGLIVNLPGVAIIWGAMYGLIRMGRWWRGVYPPEHQPRKGGLADR